MTTNREELRKRAGGQRFDNIKLDVYLRVKTKEVNGRAAFDYYVRGEDGREGERKSLASPIIGHYIGEAMCVEAFEDSLGKNGGTIKSSPYFSNGMIVLYDPTSSKPVFKGSMAECEAWAGANLSSKMLKKRRLLYVATKSGLIEINTNLSLSIDEKERFGNDNLMNNVISLTPAIYDPEDKTISKKTHEFLKIAKRNKPCYVKFGIVRKSMEDDYSEFNTDQCLHNFVLWKESKMPNGKVENIESQPFVQNDIKAEDKPKVDKRGFDPIIPPSDPIRSGKSFIDSSDNFDNDLPF